MKFKIKNSVILSSLCCLLFLVGACSSSFIANKLGQEDVFSTPVNGLVKYKTRLSKSISATSYVNDGAISGNLPNYRMKGIRNPVESKTILKFKHYSFCSSTCTTSFAPVILNDSIYLLDHNYNFYAYRFFSLLETFTKNKINVDKKLYLNLHGHSNAFNEPNWGINYNLQGDISSGGLTYRDNFFYIATYEGSVIAVNRKSRKEAWRYQGKEIIDTIPVVSKNLVLFKTTEDKLYALNKTTGKVLWSFQSNKTMAVMNSYNVPSVSVDETIDSILVSFVSGQVVSFAKNGSVRWEKNLLPLNNPSISSKAIGRLSISDKGLIIVKNTNSIYGIDNNNGKINWRKTNLYTTGTSLISGNVIFLHNNNNAYALTTTNGSLVWAHRFNLAKGDYITSNLLIKGQLFVFSYLGTITVLNTNNGKSIASYNTGQIGSYKPMVVNSKIYLLDGYGHLMSVDW